MVLMRQTIDRSSTVPLYSQIKQILISELRNAKDGDAPVLTEASLIKRFHVSRAPIRQALTELVEAGYVVRHRAKGTFPVQGLNVRLPPAMELGSLTRYLVEQGLNPTSRVTQLERVTAPKEVVDTLGLDADAEVLHLQRVISVSDLPLVWTRTYLCTPAHFSPSIAELERTGSVFALIERDLGVTFTRGEQQIWASGASREEARALDVKTGAPVLISVTTMFTLDGRPGGWRRAVHRADEFKYAFSLSVNR
jgi:GntR family transcriptional regulator